MKEFYTANEIELINNHINKYKINDSYDDLFSGIIILSITICLFIISFVFLNEYFYIGSILLGFTLVRLFIIFHDMCHQSFFYNNKLNVFFAKLLQYLFLWKYDQWKNGHNRHHYEFGDINGNDETILVLTKEKYQKLNIFYKLAYRIIRDPFVFYIIGPFFLLLNSKHNFELSGILFYGKLWLIYYLFGSTYFTGFIFANYILYFIGLILFHLQHTINIGFYDNSNHKIYHNRKNHALLGSSYIEIPYFFKWITSSIEYHHIHHFTTKVPLFKLKKCHEDGLDYWYKVPKLSYKKSLASLFNSLYNSETKLYEPFDTYKFIDTK